jgi:hypothetical protein
MHSSELKFISTTSAKCTNQSFDLRPDFKQELKSGRRDGELDACILPLETHQGQVGFTNVPLRNSAAPAYRMYASPQETSRAHKPHSAAPANCMSPLVRVPQISHQRTFQVFSRLGS